MNKDNHMKDEFLQLPKEIRLEVLQEAENTLGTPALVLEKDIWICWLLDKLFDLPTQMAFKGGTSLSKVFNLIQRFSEDIDITIDYQNFKETIDFQNISKSQLKKISNELKEQLTDYASREVKPYITSYIAKEFDKSKFNITLSDNGEKLYFVYPSVFDTDFDYLKSHVLIEFGIRNDTDPSELHQIKTTLSQFAEGKFLLPKANIEVLSPIRTFWEKATLMHVECHRKRFNDNPNRLSRHWYDLVKLADSWVGKQALKSIDILNNVLEHKKAFFNASYANYDKCHNAEFQLVPNKSEISYLENDYLKMVDAGMFQEEAMSFDAIITRLVGLQDAINKIR